MRFKAVILHPGMIHTLMSFVGCIGTLMKGSGMEQILGVAFGGMANIFNRKCWTNALRAFRILLITLLHNFLKDGIQNDQATVHLVVSQSHKEPSNWGKAEPHGRSTCLPAQWRRSCCICWPVRWADLHQIRKSSMRSERNINKWRTSCSMGPFACH